MVPCNPRSTLYLCYTTNTNYQKYFRIAVISIIFDETTDIEQMVFCLRYVDNQLNSNEEFIGMHSLDTTTSLSITRTIEDILMRLSLQLDNCRGQCYDGASAMAGCRTGVAINYHTCKGATSTLHPLI